MRIAISARGLFLFAGLVTLPLSASADDMRLGESCDLSRFGDLDRTAFLAFDQELREALKDEDTVALSLLVGFPLQVRGPGGDSIAISDPATLHARFGDAFPRQVRETVAAQKTGELFCNWTGLMYGSGAVWVSVIGHRFAVTAVNIQPVGKSRTRDPQRIARVCDAEGHRFVVEQGGRVLGWTKPRSLSTEPDIVTATVVRYAGSGLCAHGIWSFESDNTSYTLSGLGCSADSSPPPDRATGSLELVSSDGKTIHSWCY